MNSAAEREKIDILGIPVDRVTMSSALDIFRGMLRKDHCGIIVTPNSEIVQNATRNEDLAELIRGADLVIPDGIGLVKASKMLGQPLTERVTGIDFSFEALKVIAEEGKSAFLFGSKPGIAEKAAERLTERIPGLVIAGTRNGYFKPEEEEAIAEEIDASGASFLLVALGSPKQELFMEKYKGRFKNVRAAVGVGGSLDVWSGTLDRAPKFYRDHGLEWLYRLIQQPSRIGRMAEIPRFLIKVLITRRKNANRT